MQRVEGPAVDIRGDLVHEVVKHDLTTAEIDEAAQRFTGGESTVSIADSFGVDRRCVRDALHGLGLLKRKNPSTSAQIARAIRLYSDGHSLEAIGRDFGVSANTLRDRLLDNGVQTRPRPGLSEPR